MSNEKVKKSHLEEREEAIAELRGLAKRLGRRPRSYDCTNANGVRTLKVYRRLFGSWQEALVAAGFEDFSHREIRSRNRLWTKDEMLVALAAFIERCGHAPTNREADEQSDMPRSCTYVRHFGSWNRAIELACSMSNQAVKQKPKSAFSSRDKEAIVEFLRKLGESLGRRPTTGDLKRVQKEGDAPTLFMITNAFGRFSDALKAAGFEYEPDENTYVRVSRKGMLDAIRRIAKKIGHAPAFLEYSKYRQPGDPSSATIKVRFGKWNNALVAAGLTVRQRKPYSRKKDET